MSSSSTLLTVCSFLIWFKVVPLESQVACCVSLTVCYFFFEWLQSQSNVRVHRPLALMSLALLSIGTHTHTECV